MDEVNLQHNAAPTIIKSLFHAGPHPSVHLTVPPPPDIAVAIIPSAPPASARHAPTLDADRPTDIPTISTTSTNPESISNNPPQPS